MNLFQDIFQGNDAAGAAEFINNDGEMGPFLLELLQEVFDQLVFMYKIGGAQKSMPVKVIRLIEMGIRSLVWTIPASSSRLFLKTGSGSNAALLPAGVRPQRIIIFYTADIQSCPHDLFDRNAAELDDAFQDILLFFRGLVIGRPVYFIVQLLQAECRFFAAKESFQAFGFVNGPDADPAEEEVYDLHDTRGIVGELEVVLCTQTLGITSPNRTTTKATKRTFIRNSKSQKFCFSRPFHQ